MEERTEWQTHALSPQSSAPLLPLFYLPPPSPSFRRRSSPLYKLFGGRHHRDTLSSLQIQLLCVIWYGVSTCPLCLLCNWSIQRKCFTLKWKFGHYLLFSVSVECRGVAVLLLLLQDKIELVMLHSYAAKKRGVQFTNMTRDLKVYQKVAIN